MDFCCSILSIATNQQWKKKQYWDKVLGRLMPQSKVFVGCQIWWTLIPFSFSFSLNREQMRVNFIRNCAKLRNLHIFVPFFPFVLSLLNQFEKNKREKIRTQKLLDRKRWHHISNVCLVCGLKIVHFFSPSNGCVLTENAIFS